MKKIIVFIACMGSAMPCYSAPILQAIGDGTISATVSPSQSATVNIPAQYAPLCKTGHPADDCIADYEAMAEQADAETKAAQLNNLTPAAGDGK